MSAKAVQRMLDEPRFRESAQRFAHAIAQEARQSRAVDLLEELAAQSLPDTVQTREKNATL